MIFLDSTKNAVAIKEAYNRNIPTIAITNTTKDMSLVSEKKRVRPQLCKAGLLLSVVRDQAGLMPAQLSMAWHRRGVLLACICCRWGCIYVAQL